MTWIGNIITVLAVVTGVLSGATAYHVSLDLTGVEEQGLTLSTSAGVKVDDEGAAVVSDSGKLNPLFKTGTPLDSKTVKKLRANKAQLNGREITVTSVKVNEFAFSRWSGKWIFMLSAVGMIGGVVLNRMANAREAQGLRESGQTEDLLAALDDAKARLESLQQGLGSGELTESDVVDQLTQLGDDLQDHFIDHLEVLRGTLAAGTMAELMESYAVGERFMNRARSTAVDSDPHESLASLVASAERFGHTIEMIKKSL